ncbi:MAG: ABC transporter permease subunit [Hyphomicrobiaceae bacterium]
MIRFLLRRAALTIPTFFALMFLTFIMIRLVPGDPIEVRKGERGISPERLEQLRHEMGLDQPIWKQFYDYVTQILSGDFGTSIISHEKVLTEFATLFPATLELSLCAILFAVLLGIPAGVVAAVRRGGFFDQSLMTAALTGYSMPIFWWGLILILFMSNTLGLLPVSGRMDPIKYYFEPTTGFMLIDTAFFVGADQKGAFLAAVRYLILPTIVLGTVPLAVIARMTRSAMLEVLQEDYVRTARAKGLAPWRVIGQHALRNALIPVVTTIGLSITTLFGGAVLTETIFAWPGVGKWLIESIGRRDYPALQGGIMLISGLVVFVNLIVDMLYGLINPRIRHG